ncbi:aldehyde reductase [Tothia fuscella]|uniref:Aldehyde reductase n=1 Tax=Tothia fuscella TaxID=1048955 RepID=A0A9P4U1K6_9PEZI|nr:aldehyde reductase [Tothia fuscella]
MLRNEIFRIKINFGGGVCFELQGFGTGGFNPGNPFGDVDAIKEVLKVLKDHGVKNLDTAQLYGESERFLGEVHAGDEFIIDTKSQGGFDGGNALKPEVLSLKAHESIKKLGVKKVDIFYIHAPDASLKPETWLPTINDLYKEGLLERFGLSNFLPEDVEEVYKLAKEKGFVLPTVYQGNYSPVARLQDDTLFPVLRKLKIAFYAYSPLAGGFLTKTKQSIEEGAGRFNNDAIGGMYNKIYHSPLKSEQGDALIFGASRLEQLEQTITGLQRGPLKDETAMAIDGIWEKIKHVAPLDNFNSFTKVT